MNKKVLGIVIVLVIVIIGIIGGVVCLWNNKTIYPSMDEKPRFFCSNGILNYYTHQDLKKYDEWKEYILNGPERKVRGNLTFTKECYEDLRVSLDRRNENIERMKNNGVDIESIYSEMASLFSSENGNYFKSKKYLMNKYKITEDEFSDVYVKIRLELAIKYYEKLFEDLGQK
ncbi:hypothetical protein ACFL08_05600 [Patescibacteria group bacterium]